LLPFTSHKDFAHCLFRLDLSIRRLPFAVFVLTRLCPACLLIS
jgi:hypothetical protein